MKTNAQKQREASDTFVARAVAVHGSAYGYSCANYVNAATKVDVTCRKHGTFSVLPNNHIRKRSGCPKCKCDKQSARQAMSTSDAVAMFANAHAGKYTYAKVTLTKLSGRVTVTCPTHGDFEVDAVSHRHGRSGCPKCRKAYNKRTSAEFVTVTHNVWGDKFDVSSATYFDCKTHVNVTCKTHGVFRVTPDNFLRGKGCPVCGRVDSKPERFITKFIEDHGFTVERRAKPEWMDGKELDIFVPEAKLAIEYCGSPFHASVGGLFDDKPDNYHYKKWAACANAGVTLMTVFDFVFLRNPTLVLHAVSHKLQLSERVFARQCLLESVSNAVAIEFHNRNHIDGASLGASDHYGLRYKQQLVAVMSCGNEYSQSLKRSSYAVKRLSTLSGVAVVGGVSKLRSAAPNATMRVSHDHGGCMTTTSNKASLRYWWVSKDSKQALSRNSCQRNKLENKFGIPLSDADTEETYMVARGYRKVFNSGISTL